MKKKVAIVSGGAGFIGSFVCEKLLEDKIQVICVDNLISGREENLANCLTSVNFSFLDYDVCLPFEVAGVVDYIFHLASPASPVDYYKYPLETMLANSAGTYNLLELAKKKKARFLLASTSEIYGDPAIHPQKENYWGNVNPVGDRACYDESKRFAEAMTMVYFNKHKVNVRIVRIFNTYGPRMRKDDGRVVSNFINQAIKGEPMTVYGKGDQTRSFCYVTDMVSGIYLAMVKGGTNGEIINLGNPDERKIVEFAKLIGKLSGSNSKIVYGDLPCDDPVRRKPDIGKAEKLLGWQPKVGLREGLIKTIDYYLQFGG